MSSIEEAKRMLKTKGYCTFNLKDFNIEYYNYIEQTLKCTPDRNLKSSCKSLRANYMDNNTKQHISIQKKFESFQAASEVKEDIISNNPIDNIMQIWHTTEGLSDNQMEGYDSNKDPEKLTNIYKSITRYFYEIEAESHLSNFTYYAVGCHLRDHSDGTGTGRLCACLIYLNEVYDENDGGCLILNNELKVIPVLGNIAIIDLWTYDIRHEVTKVTGGEGRYAVLSFIRPGSNYNPGVPIN